ncbi:glycerate kinase [Candidatus Bathyarchaeota archaeon]|nr:glycerate kinase [Candidatus Bathyarchaeota archaeon]
MHIKNSNQLINNGVSEALRKLRGDAITVLEAALNSVDPYKAVLNNLKIVDGKLRVGNFEASLDDLRKIVVIGGGKAGGAMAEAVESVLGDRVSGGCVNVLQGTEFRYNLKKIRLQGASHPIPNNDGVRGVAEMLMLISSMREKDLVICLISGGGSALMPYPAEGISLEDKQDVTSRLLMKGATIDDLNAVRKHLSAIKGGQLARRCYPTRVVSLILSDVVGDPLDTIASGPTSPDTTTFRNAVDVLKKYKLWDDICSQVRERLEYGVKKVIVETPKPGDEIFNHVTNIIVGNNSIAAESAAEAAEALGYNSLIVSTMVEGEAAEVGTVLAGIARELAAKGRPLKPPAAVIVGGETTVNVRGSGRGGRNQELALSLARRITGLKAVAASLATDGIDGPTEASGAIVDGETSTKASKAGLSIEKFLAENDSHSFFKKIGDTIVTGPTGTNVNDLVLIITSED